MKNISFVLFLGMALTSQAIADTNFHCTNNAYEMNTMTLIVKDQDKITNVLIDNMPLEYLVAPNLKLAGDEAKVDSTEFMSNKDYEMTSTGYVWPITVKDLDGDENAKGVVELYYISHHKGKKRSLGTAFKQVYLDFRSSAWNSLSFYFDGFTYSYTCKKQK